MSFLLGKHGTRSSRQPIKSHPPVFGVSLSDLPPSELPIPSVVRTCVSFIETNCLKVQGIFRVPGVVSQILELKSRFDSGENVDFSSTTNPNDVCGVLKLYFRELGEPLIPYGLFSQVFSSETLTNLETFEDFLPRLKKLINLLPDNNRILLHYLCQFLALVASYHHYNKMTVENISLVFVPNIIRSSSSDKKDLYNPKDMKPFVTCFKLLIQHFEEIFSTGDEEIKENLDEISENLEMSPPLSSPSPPIKSPLQSDEVDYLSQKVINQLLFGDVDLIDLGLVNQRQSNVEFSTLCNSINEDFRVKSHSLAQKWRKEVKNEAKKITNTRNYSRDYVAVSFRDLSNFDIQSFSATLFQLKSEIHDFEHKFQMNNNGKKPHGRERDPIRPKLEEYFNLHRKLKNICAIKIQSLIRAFLKKKNFQNSGMSAQLSPLEVLNYRLAAIRIEEKRPSDMNLMNLEQKKQEKTAIKRELRNFDLNFEQKYGREPSREDKEIMRPLYHRYKSIGKMIDDESKLSTVQESAELFDTILLPQISLPAYSEPVGRCMSNSEYHSLVQTRAQLRDDLRRLSSQVVAVHRKYIEVEKRMSAIERM
ncbi:hypothetical protein P9112_012854 [Eukaryota sp. TZLM1-RC]